MKKNTISRLCTYTLIGLISLTSVLATANSALPQTVKAAPVKQIPLPSSNLIWPTHGIVSQGFRKYQHEGIDIAGAIGTPVVAAASGTIVKAGWDDWGLGNLIEIRHPDGSATVYGHNNRLLVSKGQEVTQGQIIAEMGSTGNSTAPHLHFEFYRDGRLAIDPIKLLSSPTTAQLPVEQPVTPSQPIPVSIAPIKANVECAGTAVITGETAKIRVQVCEENGQLFYIGQSKQDASNPVKIVAWNVGKNKYRADNGSFSYLVSPEKVEVWRNGSQIRSDSFNTSQHAGN
ncbi:M23 family metallopeptidase [Sphaerospermopsis aphanizomenoides BCCUSP55]|uniref:M23 family metallopeptidase n=1 Tax=Sphaerospermopsis aphanizomenoides TaxID=459663 RepID=UPI000AB966DA|nr:M23 family metallopeptidase [Sphaerospermopsis aphanizomenoides]MBK1987812.1 M23 family metallopeptidase [Sphaerospermopsis aphanizomenoides BCCUSP55]